MNSHSLRVLRPWAVALVLAGAVLMVANVWLTILGKQRVEKPMHQAAYDPAADRPIVQAEPEYIAEAAE